MSTARTASCNNSNFTFTRQSQIDSFPITNPGCTVVQDLMIDGTGANPAITRLDSLKYITEVTGQLNVSHTKVPDLNGLSGLQRIGWILWLDTDSLISNIKPPNVTYINGVVLNEMPAVTSLAGFLTGLTNTRLDYFWFFNTVPITDFNGLQGMDSINHIGVAGLPGFQNFNGIQGFRYCEDLFMWGCDQLNDVSAFSNITRLPFGNLSITSDYALTSLNGLQNITYVYGVLTLQGTSFTSLTAAGLNPVMDIGWNNQNDTLYINDNYNLSVCDWPPLCNYLSAGKPAYVYSNAPGCNNVADVQAACNLCTAVGLKTWTGSAGTDWDNPANWLPAGVPQACDSVVIPQGLSFYPQLSNNINVHALTMEPQSYFDFNGFGASVNVNIKIDNAQIDNGTYLTAASAASVFLSQSILLLNDVKLLNCRDTVTLWGNYFGGGLALTDNAGRTEDAYVNGNYFEGDLSIIANAPDKSTYVSSDLGNTVNGALNVTINDGSYVEIGYGNQTNIGGDLNVNNNYPYALSLGYLSFEGGNDSHIKQLGSEPVSLYGFYTNKNFGSKIILDQDISVQGDCRFGVGLVNSSPGALLIFQPGAYISQTSSASWVNGPIRLIGYAPFAFTFPVGDAAHGAAVVLSSYAFTQRGNSTASTSSADEFTVQYRSGNPSSAGYDTSHHAATLQTVSGKEYWTINHDAGTSGLYVSLVYDSTRSGQARSVNDLRVTRWNGTQWADEGVSKVTGDLREAFVKTAGTEADYGVYTLGYYPTRVPVITLGAMDTLACRYQAVKVPFSLDTLALPNNVFTAQLSDSTGSFAAPTAIGSITGNHSDTIAAYIPYYLPLKPGYRIRVIGSAPLDTSVNYRTVRTGAQPDYYNITGLPVICAGGVTKFYAAQKQAGVTYTWTLSGLAVPYTTTADTLYLNPTATGYFNVTLAATNSCGTTYAYYYGARVAAAPTAAPTVTRLGRWLYATAQLPSGASGHRWYRNDTLLASATASSYYASLAGGYKVVFYNADCGNGPASNVISFVANSIPQSIGFPAVSNKTYGDSSFVLNASASSGLPVEFTVVSGPGNILGNVFYITGAGTVTVKASQVGDDVYDTASSLTRTFTVNKAPQAITFASIADKDYSVGSFALSATTASGLPVMYSVQSGPATLSGNTLTLTGVGTVAVRASQTGDNNYLAALPVDRSFCVRVAALNGINGPVNICPGIAATYTTAAVPGAAYNWRLLSGSAFASTTNTLTTTWPSPGTHTLIVTAAGTCGLPSKADTLAVTAIPSVQPDSVHNMLPAAGAVNQQLPLTLSWIPAAPNLSYTYDVYVWKAADPQPATPFAGNLTTVNYTLVLNSGLAYNTTYKWMVVAHNGSCTQINTGPVQQFSLIPLPDLQVYNVTAPATAFSGQPVSVTWKVRNNGPGTTLLNQSWTDAVFISKDSALDFTNPAGQLQFPVIPLLVATKPAVSALNAGDSYSDTATFALPVDYSGPLYFYVVTNYAPPAVNAVIETTYANDTAHALPVTAVTLSPQPDFRVDTVVNPGNTFSGSTINVTFKVKNYGVTAAGSWVDKIYLSKDAVFNPATALRLTHPGYNGSYFPQTPADIYKGGSLQADSSYTVSVQAVVPNFIFGQYYVYVVTNAAASVYEGPNNGNNVARGNGMQIFLTQTPKLVPSNVSIPSVIGTAQTVTVSWNTQNQGAYDNIQKNLYPFGLQDTLHPWGRSQWYDRAYLSTDSGGVNVATNLLIADIYQNNDIYPGKYFYAQPHWPVPDNLPPGDYWLYVFANATRSVFEYPGGPQVVRSGKITVVRPDLTVPSVSVPASGASGQTVTVNYTVQNNSGGAVNDRYRRDYIYLGDNSTFDGTAVLIDSAIYTGYALAANGSLALQKSVVLPNGTGGAKYVFVRANGFYSFNETSFANNTSVAGAPIAVALTPSPDLVVSSVNAAPAVTSNVGFPFAYTVTNNGPGTAQGRWKDSVFISCSSTFSYGTAYYVADRTQQTYLPVWGTYTDSFSLKMPQTFFISNSGCLNNDVASVYFFVKTNAGNGIYEAVTGNNVLGTAGRTVTNAIVDHIVSTVKNDDSATVGRSVKVVWTVKNPGLNPADNTYTAWYDGVFLSTDSVLSNDDRFLGNKYENTRLNANATYSDSASFSIPDLPAGHYYLIVKTNLYNQIPAERELSNNADLRRDGSNVPVKTYISNPPPPDLVVSITGAPASVAAGQPLKIVYTVTNNGASATYSAAFYNNLWLSNSFSEGGYFLGQPYINRVLQPGESVTDSLVTILPLGFTQGNYVLVARANTGSVYEANYTNNYAYRYISVYTPAPVDLMVNSITAADTLTLGYAANVSWKILNNSGNTATGFATDGIYLSADTASANTADVLIGAKKDTLNLLPLNSALQSAQPVVSGVPEGTYYLKVRADILRNIIETNTANNTGLLNRKVYVTVKALPLNTVMPDALTNNYLYYKLVIPAALRGRTVQVKLTSNDSLTVTNQLYIGLGYLPSAAKFDYSHSAAGGGNQSIIIESVVDSVYYIAARSTKTGIQQIKLQAIELPFALLTVVSNRGGNTGAVTIRLNGTLFGNGMTAKIRGLAANNTITATSFYFVNGTTAYATFNLRGAPLGLYDVSLLKPDNSIALLASSFTVEKGSNGGLLTGGDNTGQTGSGTAPGCDPGAAGGLNTQLQTELNIPPKVFAKWPFVITINYTNASNVDIPAQVRVLYSHDGAPLGLTEADLAAGKTSLVIEFKDSFGAPNVIRAGSTGTIRIYSKAPPTATAHSFVHFNLQ